MKGINGNPALDAYNRVAVTPVARTRPSEKADVGQTPDAPAEQAAKVSISNTARQLAAGAESGASAERVRELKQSVAAGNFQVDPQLIAQRLLDALG